MQHLGAIYERLLERDSVPDGPGGVRSRPIRTRAAPPARYYTPDELVQLILRRAVGPLLEERRAAFAGTEPRRCDPTGRPKAERLADLARLDPAEAFVALRICDPAMGSGHFLVSLVDYLADAMLAAMTDAAAAHGRWTRRTARRSPRGSKRSASASAHRGARRRLARCARISSTTATWCAASS